MTGATWRGFCPRPRTALESYGKKIDESSLYLISGYLDRTSLLLLLPDFRQLIRSPLRTLECFKIGSVGLLNVVSQTPAPRAFNPRRSPCRDPSRRCCYHD